MGTSVQEADICRKGKQPFWRVILLWGEDGKGSGKDDDACEPGAIGDASDGGGSHCKQAERFDEKPGQSSLGRKKRERVNQAKGAWR